VVFFRRAAAARARNFQWAGVIEVAGEGNRFNECAGIPPGDFRAAAPSWGSSTATGVLRLAVGDS
jgi:hypothetical protein